MLKRYAKKHTVILSVAAMTLSIFVCATNANNSYAENSETACSQVPLSEAEYCIDIDSSYGYNARYGYGYLRNVVVDESWSRLYADLVPGMTPADGDSFSIVGDPDDSPTNYYYATNNATPESGLPIVITGGAAGLMIFTTSGAVRSMGLALVDSDGYLLSEYTCRIVGATSATFNDNNYLRCLLSEPADGEESKIPKRGAILRLYYLNQIPEERPYVEPDPEPDPEPEEDEPEEQEIENVETSDSLANNSALLTLSIITAAGLIAGFTVAKRK